MKTWRVVLGLVYLGACASPPPPAPPVVASATPAPEPPASSAYTPVPLPPPPPRFQTAAPFSLVARAAPDAELNVLPDPAGALILASSAGMTHLAVVQGDQVTALPELSSRLPGSSPTERVDIQGVFREKIGATWWAQIGRTLDGPRVEFLRFGPGGWWVADQVPLGETGLLVTAQPLGEQVFYISHASASHVPTFFRTSQGSARLPKFTETHRHPHGCISRMTSVLAFRVWPSGEALALGTSCWIPLLQIEQWGPKQQRSTAWEFADITIHEPSRISILSPSEFLLNLVTIRGVDNQFFHVKIVKKNGVWKIHERSRMSFPDPKPEEADALLKKLNAQLNRSWIVGGQLYHEAIFPKDGAPIETVLLRYSPIKEPIEF